MFLVRGAQRVRKVKKLHISEKNNCDRKKIKISSNGDEKDALNSRKRMRIKSRGDVYWLQSLTGIEHASRLDHSAYSLLPFRYSLPM